jgi:hypothetical protein
VQKSLSERLFAQRSELLYTLDQEQERPEADAAVRAGLADRLRAEVAGMNRDNVEVRRHLRAVDTYLDPARRPQFPRQTPKRPDRSKLLVNHAIHDPPRVAPDDELAESGGWNGYQRRRMLM